MGIAATINYWKERNCNGNAMSLIQSIDNEDDDTFIKQYDSGICNANIRYYNVEGGGHRWPDPSGDNGVIITSLAGTASHEISTVEEIISFFGI